MIINSDERQWTWMDEGLTTFTQYLTEVDWAANNPKEKDFPFRRGPAKKIVPYMLLDTAYKGRMEVAKNYAFLLAHNIQQEQEEQQAEDKMVIRAMLACSTCSDKQKAVLGYFFEMVDGLKDY